MTAKRRKTDEALTKCRAVLLNNFTMEPVPDMQRLASMIGWQVLGISQFIIDLFHKKIKISIGNHHFFIDKSDY
jgi:hypothetical protein